MTQKTVDRAIDTEGDSVSEEADAEMGCWLGLHEPEFHAYLLDTLSRPSLTAAEVDDLLIHVEGMEPEDQFVSQMVVFHWRLFAENGVDVNDVFQLARHLEEAIQMRKELAKWRMGGHKHCEEVRRSLDSSDLPVG